MTGDKVEAAAMANLAAELEHLAQMLDNPEHLVTAVLQLGGVSIFDTWQVIAEQSKRDGLPMPKALQLADFLRRCAHTARTVERLHPPGHTVVRS